MLEALFIYGRSQTYRHPPPPPPAVVRMHLSKERVFRGGGGAAVYGTSAISCIRAGGCDAVVAWLMSWPFFNQALLVREHPIGQ